MDQKKILIVEDDRDVRLGLSVLLGREFEVLAAEDGISAMVIARRERPAAIVLDLGLPGGDGLEVLRWLQEVPELAFTPTIVVTGRDGGQVEEDALGRGAALVFQKPADPEELLHAVRNATSLRDVQRKRVLMVEDDADTREGLAVRLRAHDLVVFTAADGASALVKARKSKPDVVLLDLGLPAGGGLSVLERLKKIDEVADVPVIVLSGRDPEGSLQSVLDAGAHAYLTKPTNDMELMDAIGAVL